ncbi:MAG: exodeoxyribonuclease VII large subunit [Candidatus Dojkabacteria bacterium]|nr:exodeoxyribonuclease VII large subunit [Candidatus Dojkabacteria bacterium]
MIQPDLSNQIISVSEFNSLIKDILTNLGTFQIKGEITELRITPNKGLYLTLSDGKANLRVGGYAPNIKGVDLVEKDMDVIVRGTADLYVPYGSFTFSAVSIEPVGEGSLSIAYQKLKEKLESEGLFAKEHKQELPQFITKIALLTGKDSAAYSDFVKILDEHNSGVEVYYYPVLVQGDKSPKEIQKALSALQDTDVDLVVLTRGGGSLEDLKSFNDEELARAIFASSKLVIAGVGHEKDESIADFVADIRASTPSQAAYYILDQNQRFLDSLAERLDIIIDYLSTKISEKENKLESLQNELNLHINQLLTNYSEKVDSLERVLASFNTENILKRGFAIINKNGNQIKSVKSLNKKDKIKAIMADGSIDSEILNITPNTNGSDKKRKD